MIRIWRRYRHLVFSFVPLYSKHWKEDRSANDLSTEEWRGFKLPDVVGHPHEVKVRSCASVERFLAWILASRWIVLLFMRRKSV